MERKGQKGREGGREREGGKVIEEGERGRETEMSEDDIHLHKHYSNDGVTSRVLLAKYYVPRVCMTVVSVSR